MASKYIKSFRNKSLTTVTKQANDFISQEGVLDAVVEHGQEIGTGSTKQHILVVTVTYEAVRSSIRRGFGGNIKCGAFEKSMAKDCIEELPRPQRPAPG